MHGVACRRDGSNSAKPSRFRRSSPTIPGRYTAWQLGTRCVGSSEETGQARGQNGGNRTGAVPSAERASAAGRYTKTPWLGRSVLARHAFEWLDDGVAHVVSWSGPQGEGSGRGRAGAMPRATSLLVGVAEKAGVLLTLRCVDLDVFVHCSLVVDECVRFGGTQHVE